MCTVCDETEEVLVNDQKVLVYCYRCSRCGGCYACQHGQVGYEFWICTDGVKIPVDFDIGLIVDAECERQHP